MKLFDVLINKGGETLRNIIKNAKNFPLEGVLNLDNIWFIICN